MKRETANWGERRGRRSLSRQEKLRLIGEVIRLGRELISLLGTKPSSLASSGELRRAEQIISRLSEIDPQELVGVVGELASPEEYRRTMLELARSDKSGGVPPDQRKVMELFEAIDRSVKTCLDAREGDGALSLTEHLEALIGKGYDDLKLLSAFCQLGIPLAEKGHLEEAKSLLRNVVQLLKRHPDLMAARRSEVCARINLGYVLFLRGSREEAELELRTLLAEIRGMEPELLGMVLIQLAYFKMLEGLPQQALSIMRSVEESGSLPRDPLARRNALIFQALVETAAGSPSKAKHLITTLLSEPNHHMRKELEALMTIADWRMGVRDREEMNPANLDLGRLEMFRELLLKGEGGEERTLRSG